MGCLVDGPLPQLHPISLPAPLLDSTRTGTGHRAGRIDLLASGRPAGRYGSTWTSPDYLVPVTTGDNTKNPDRPQRIRVVTVAGIGLAIGLAVITASLIRADGDPSRLVHAAPPFTDAGSAPDYLWVGEPEDGYDGQFYFRLALSPIDTSESVEGLSLDVAPLRSQRIAYPILARTLSLQQASLLPWAMIVVNLAAIGVVGWAGARMAVASGRAPGWGLLFVAWPGFVYSLGFDLAEVVLAASVLTALALFRSGNAPGATVAMCVAVLTRETGIIVPVSLLLSGVWLLTRGGNRAEARKPIIVGAVPLGVFTMWQCFLWSRWDELPATSSGGKNARVPFEGLISAADGFFPPTSAAAVFRIVSLGLIVLAAGIALASLRDSRALSHEKVGAALAIGLVVVLSEHVWAGAASFMRGATDAWILGCVVALNATSERIQRFFIPLLAVSAALCWMLTLAKP